MTCVVCGQRIEEGRQQGQRPRLAKCCLRCRADRRRRAKLKYSWRSEYDTYLKAQYFGGLNRRFQVLNRMIRLTGLPRWYIKRQAARLASTSLRLNFLTALRFGQLGYAKRLRHDFGSRCGVLEVFS
jgi:hypothetical protein